MTNVFLLWHHNASTNDDKLVGVFESETKAKDAIQTTLNLPGFKDNPDGFLVDQYEIDEIQWAEGFGTPTGS